MKLSSILLVATCVLMVESQTGDSTTYSPPSTGSTVGFTNCPSSLTYGGGDQKYRFVEDVAQFPGQHQNLPCVGDIDTCVYTAHTNYYCMRGNKPDYTPRLLNPHWQNVTFQNVETSTGVFTADGDNFEALNIGNPIRSIKLFPNIFQSFRVVWGGFILKYYGDPTIYKFGYTTEHGIFPPTYIPFSIGQSITEAHGRFGSVIDQLTLGKTKYFVDPTAQPTFEAVGGPNGFALFDATPPPNLNGHCALLGLKGQTRGAGDLKVIQAITFVWSCVGKPQCYVSPCPVQTQPTG